MKPTPDPTRLFDPSSGVPEALRRLVIESLARRHRSDEAVARAVALAKRFPNSVHLPRIRAVLGQSESP
jgi:hypothetical protein